MHVQPSDRPLRALDLFCGAGGFSEGFRQSGFELVGGLDIDPDAIATYAYNFTDAQAICGDVREAAVRGRVLEVGAGVDVIIGGPPCQAFSQVRNHARLIDDPRNGLYREFVGALDALEPVAFVMENVPGMDQMGVREQVREDLSLGGRYAVISQVVDAADHGVPQTRQRLIFLGVHADLATTLDPLVGSHATRDLDLQRRARDGQVSYQVQAVGIGSVRLAHLRDPDDLSVISIEQAIGDLTVLETGQRGDEVRVAALPPPTSAYQRVMRAGLGAELSNVQVPRINDDTVLRLRAIPEGGNHRDLPEDYLARYLTGDRWGPHNGSGRLTRKHYYAYRKLHRQFWAWTLNTKADSAYHYETPRALSVREFARIQSFPDRFRFVTDPRSGPLPGRIDGGAAHSRYRQVGNAVPPLLARQIGEHLMSALRGRGIARMVA